MNLIRRKNAPCVSERKDRCHCKWIRLFKIVNENKMQKGGLDIGIFEMRVALAAFSDRKTPIKKT